MNHTLSLNIIQYDRINFPNYIDYYMMDKIKVSINEFYNKQFQKIHLWIAGCWSLPLLSEMNSFILCLLFLWLIQISTKNGKKWNGSKKMNGKHYRRTFATKEGMIWRSMMFDSSFK